MSTQRLSNIELLRIVAIIMIVMMHGIGYALHCPNDLNRMGVTAINTVGNMGVTIFMLISGYFGIHFRWSRLFSLWVTALFYAIVTFFADASWSPLALYHALTPITSMKWWFLSWYVVIFCLAPFLNKAVEGMAKRHVELLLGFLLFFFLISPTFLFHSMTNDWYGKGLPNMITAYIIGQYVAKCDLPLWFTKHSGKWFVMACGIVFFGSFVAGCISLTASNILCKDNNLFVMIGAVSLFCWVRKCVFSSSFVNYIASFSFPIYLINESVFNYLAPLYVGDVNSVTIWLPYFSVVVVVVLLAWIVESVRRLLFGRLNELLGEKIDRRLGTITFP